MARTLSEKQHSMLRAIFRVIPENSPFQHTHFPRFRNLRTSSLEFDYALREGKINHTHLLAGALARFRAWACGAAGSALPWHGRGRRFDPDQVHQIPQQVRQDDSLPEWRLGRGLCPNPPLWCSQQGLPSRSAWLPSAPDYSVRACGGGCSPADIGKRSLDNVEHHWVGNNTKLSFSIRRLRFAPGW